AGSVLGTALRNGGGALITDPTVPATVSNIFSSLAATSAFLHALTPNGTLDGAGNLNASPTLIRGHQVALYHFNDTAVQGLGQLNLNFGSADTVVLNVGADGSGLVNFVAPPNMIGGFSQSNSAHIIWNFYDATTVKVNNTFNGAILALNADFQLLGG